MAVVRGSCLCGSFRFEIDGPIRFLKNCHCSRCRKMSGSSFATYARAGLLDDDPRVAVAYDIYVGSRAPWSELPRDRPCFEEMGEFPADSAASR